MRVSAGTSATSAVELPIREGDARVSGRGCMYLSRAVVVGGMSGIRVFVRLNQYSIRHCVGLGLG
jgi:hypothetical protein